MNPDTTHHGTDDLGRDDPDTFGPNTPQPEQALSTEQVREGLETMPLALHALAQHPNFEDWQAHVLGEAVELLNATRAELDRLRAALAEAEARLEDSENGYQRLWNALWDVRERLERGWNCSPSQLIDFMQAAQEVELDPANWPAKALATAQGEQGVE